MPTSLLIPGQVNLLFNPAEQIQLLPRPTDEKLPQSLHISFNCGQASKGIFNNFIKIYTLIFLDDQSSETSDIDTARVYKSARSNL